MQHVISIILWVCFLYSSFLWIIITMNRVTNWALFISLFFDRTCVRNSESSTVYLLFLFPNILRHRDFVFWFLLNLLYYYSILSYIITLEFIKVCWLTVFVFEICFFGIFGDCINYYEYLYQYFTAFEYL